MNKRTRIRDVANDLETEIEFLRSTILCYYRSREDIYPESFLAEVRSMSDNIVAMIRKIKDINNEVPKRKKKRFKFDSETVVPIVITIGVFIFGSLILGLFFAGILHYKSSLS